MGEMVRYHNDLNKVKLPNFTAQEENLFCGLLLKIKEKPAGRLIQLEPKDFNEMSRKNLTNKELIEIIDSFREKFFKADFRILLKEGNLLKDRRVNLFKEYTATYWLLEDDSVDILASLDIIVNPEFEYLINELTKNYTGFELAEFVSLSSGYTKRLYRLLKQFRTTGLLYMEWDEFLSAMDIPKNYLMSDIDKRILKPAIKELTRERTLWDIERIPFENLKYEKIKKNNKKTGKVSAIKFTFKKQQQEPKFKKEKISIEEHERRERMRHQFGMDKLNRYFEKRFRNEENHICKITGVNEYGDDKHIIVTYTDMDTNEHLKAREFKHESHLQQWLEKYGD